MLKILTIVTLLLSSVNIFAQFPLDALPKQIPDTLYFNYEDDVQLIIIDNYDTYNRFGAWYDGMYPRGGSWFLDNRPAPRNVYIFRDKQGEILKTFNSSFLIDTNSLKSNTYINTTELSLFSVSDYVELNNHLMFYGDNNKVGLINLKGEVVVPAIYDQIRKYQDDNERRDKLIIVKDNKFGFLDSTLNVLFSPIYRTKVDTNYVGYPEHSVIDGRNIKVFKDNKCGLISEEGEVLVDFLFDDIRIIHDDMYIGLIYREKNKITHSIKGHWNWGYQVKTCIIFDNAFNVITKLDDFEYIYYYGIKRFIVKKDNKFGVLNHLGEIIVPLTYDHLSQENGVYHVSKNNKFGIINVEGKIVIPIQYNRFHFYGQAIYATKDGLIGVYNKQFKLIAEPQFQSKTWDMGKFVLTRTDGTKGFVKHQKEGSFYQSPEGEIIKL